MAYGVIYGMLDKTNGKIYVGQTKDFNQRISQHRNGSLYVDKAIRKHGWENVIVEVLEECETPEQLNEREIFWIAFFDCTTPNGYNLTDGGEYMQGFQSDLEVIAKSLETRKKTFAQKSPEELRQMTANARAVAMARTPEERGAAAKKAWYHRTPEERSAILKKSWKTRRANDAAKTQEERDADTKRHSESARRGNQKRSFEEKSTAIKEGLAKMSPAAIVAKLQKSFIKRRAETPFKNLLAEIDKRQFTYSSLAKLMGLHRKSISLKMSGKVNFLERDIAKLVEIF